MNSHPINLALRFLLEVAILVVFAWWGWNKFSGLARYSIAIGLPLLAAAVWGIFRVDGDPGKAIVAISGWLRLLYELLLFASASYMLITFKMEKWAYIFMAISVLHYLISYDRILWLLKN
ncbi:MAG TPA: YrdB family protein [Flavisolibacter sp.]|jgi:hypothetical protein|nr:YrdB family protein [Flavisolibacter sp.]